MKQVIVEKQAQVEEIKAKIAQSSSVVVTDYRGLTVEEVTELRGKLRAEGIEYKVLKNNLVKRACDASGIEGMDEVLKGPTAVAFGPDAIAPAKVLYEFLKKHKNLQVKGGIVEGAVMDAAKLEILGNLPSREALLSQIVGMFAAPLRNFIGAVDALREKQEKEAS